MPLYNNVIRNNEETENWMEKEDYNFLERLNALKDTIMAQPPTTPTTLVPTILGEYGSLEDLQEAYRNKTLGKEYISKELNKLEAYWNLLPDGAKRGIVTGLSATGEVLGNTWEDLKTVEGAERYDPFDWITSWLAHGIDFAGDKLDKYVAKPTAWALHNWAGLDERIANTGGLVAEILLTRKLFKALPKGIELFNKGLDSKQMHGVAFKAGQWLDEALGSFKPANQRTITLNKFSTIVDDTVNLDLEIFNKARRIYQNQPDAGWTSALTMANRLKGMTIKGLIEGDLPLNKLHARLMQSGKRGLIYDKDGNPIDPKLHKEDSVYDNELNLWGISSKRERTTAIDLFNKRMRDGLFIKNENGLYYIDEAKFKNLTPGQQKDYAQFFQTELGQAVPRLFKRTTELEVPRFNEKYEAYLNKYGGKPEVHHIFPSLLSMRFWFGEEYMGKNWYRLKEVANEYKQFPGEPSIEGEPINLVTLPSAIGKNDPNYKSVIERFGHIPPHIHNIVHNEILTNLIGQRGGKFFTKETLAKMNSGIDGKVEVFRDWNEVMKLTSEMVDEAMLQLDVLFSNRALSENPEKLTSMLEEYFGTGDIKIGSSIIKDRKGNIIMEDGKPKIATYSQFAVKDIVSRSFSDFTDALLEKPRWKEVELEVSKFSHLNEDERLNVANILYQIKLYNGLKMWHGTTKAGVLAFGKGKNVKYYNELIDLYMDVVDEAEGTNSTHTITTIEQLRNTTFKDFVKPSITEQLEILFPDTQLELPLINDR